MKRKMLVKMLDEKTKAKKQNAISGKFKMKDGEHDENSDEGSIVLLESTTKSTSSDIEDVSYDSDDDIRGLILICIDVLG